MSVFLIGLAILALGLLKLLVGLQTEQGLLAVIGLKMCAIGLIVATLGAIFNWLELYAI